MISKIPFSERYKYITATEIGCIVKHYLNLDFKTFEDINLIFSKKKWTVEQIKEYDNLKYEYNKFIFGKGKDFECKISEELHDIYGAKNIQDFSIGEFSFCDKKLGISATPDFLIEGKTLIETKASSCETENLQNYKYQLAQQCLLIPNFKIELEGYEAKIYFKIEYDKNISYEGYLVAEEEILEMQKQILECVPKFYKDLENNNFNFISFDEAIKPFIKEEIETNDDDIVNAFNLKNQIKDLENQYKEIEAKIISNYDKYNYVISNNIRTTISKESISIKDENYIEKEIDKKTKEIEKLQELKNKIINKEVEAEKTIKKRFITFKYLDK